jgi:hypothetical protein
VAKEAQPVAKLILRRWNATFICSAVEVDQLTPEHSIAPQPSSTPW